MRFLVSFLLVYGVVGGAVEVPSEAPIEASFDLLQKNYNVTKLVKPSPPRQKMTPLEISAFIQAWFRASGLPDETFFTSEQQQFWMIPPNHEKLVSCLGFWLRRKGKRWFVAHVFDWARKASPIRKGDEIISVDGKEVNPFAYVNEESRIEYLVSYKSVPWDKPRTVGVRKKSINFADQMLLEMKASEAILQRKDKSVGYVRVFSLHHESTLSELELILERLDRKTDGLVLDLRMLFAAGERPLQKLFLGRVAKGEPVKASYNKPVVVLVDEYSSASSFELVKFFRSESRGYGYGDLELKPVTTYLTKAILDNQYAIRFPKDPTLPAPTALDVTKKSPLVYSGGHDELITEALTWFVAKL